MYRFEKGRATTELDISTELLLFSKDLADLSIEFEIRMGPEGFLFSLYKMKAVEIEAESAQISSMSI